MVPIPYEFTYDYWIQGPTEYAHTNLTCLMPNGNIILLDAHYNATLADIKEDLWIEAQKQPLYGSLHDMSVYVFMYVNSMAEMEEITDETRRLCDIRPTAAVLKVTECIGEKADHSFNVQIGHLIGKRLQEFDALSNAEINDFRFQMRKLGDEIALARSKKSWIERLHYHFPPRLAPIPPDLQDQNSVVYQNNCIVLVAKIEQPETTFTFHVPHEITPEKLLTMILAKKANLLNIRGERVSDYILKVCGQDEFLCGERSLLEFQYIQDAISRDVTPTLVPIHIEDVPMQNENDYETLNILDNKKPRSSFSTHTLRKKGKHRSAWDIRDNFKVTVSTVTGLNCDIKRSIEIGVQAGIFHGGKSLCESQKTSEVLVTEKYECNLEEVLEFKIEVCNIPKNAKLCFVVYEVTKNSKGVKTKKIKETGNNRDLYYNPIAWANTTIYDFRNQLKRGAITLYMWAPTGDMNDEVLNPLGTVVSNPNTKYATALTLTFNKCGEEEQAIVYPTVEAMISHVKKRSAQSLNDEETVTQTNIQNVQTLICDSDSLYDCHDQDKKNVWAHRRYWLKHLPESLPKVLHCIDWNNCDDVSDVVSLLREWPVLPVEKALELLDYAYADEEVRKFAVKCLHEVSDEDLLLYLLQLVQAIKHELYLDCDLVKFLLQRALKNQKIGHYLFWHLRSEMQVPSVSVRFGLILEAYCRGSHEHMQILNKQLECLEKLKKSSELVRCKRDKEKAKLTLQEFLEEKHVKDAVHNMRSPLDPSCRCTRVKMEKCKVMDSKMRPLWVVFENSDLFGDDIYIIFKNGDDLRQDMLTLQMLRIMDRLWKREGLDLRMNPYNCISMDNRVGMIEVVLNAETIANIQKEKGMFSATSAFRKGSLLAWLKDHNTTETALKKAINEFTLSCAGYCVATYVLGVADRHSDNIMVKKTGQLFHIDFGHILGHFKEKFGFKRERVPFVLTHDFVHVISKGQKNNLEFKLFQEYCEKAFLILRKHGGLILSLFAMMISTGLPELSSEKDLNYLKETLVLSKSEEDALKHFRSKFDEALCNSWKTSLNWASHNLAKNNKP